jgi:hypothetical protein
MFTFYPRTIINVDLPNLFGRRYRWRQTFAWLPCEVILSLGHGKWIWLQSYWRWEVIEENGEIYHPWNYLAPKHWKEDGPEPVNITAYVRLERMSV